MMTIESPYDAAGSLLLLVVRVYFRAQLFFMGSEFTKISPVRMVLIMRSIRRSGEGVVNGTYVRAEKGLTKSGIYKRT